MSAITCPLPKVTNPSDTSRDGDRQVCVCDPHIKACKSSNDDSVVLEVYQRKDGEEIFTSASSEFCSDRMEDTENSAVEKKLSDRLIPAAKDDILQEHMTRPMWDTTLKKDQTGFTEKQTQQEVFEGMKHVLKTPCLSSESLLVPASGNGHHINLDDDTYCNTDEDKKNPCESSEEFRRRRTTTDGKEIGKRCRLTERLLWQTVDEDGRPLPFGAVSSARKGPNDDKANGADIWIRLDWVSVLIAQIIEEMKRDHGDRPSTKSETHVAREEENSSLVTTEDAADIPLNQSSTGPRSFPVKEEHDVKSEIYHHEALVTVTSTEDSFSHPKPMETQISSMSLDCCGSCETHIHPTTPSSSEQQEITTSTGICKIGAACNSSEHFDREPAEGKYRRRHGIFRRFSSFIFQCWRDRRARKTRPDEDNRSAK